MLRHSSGLDQSPWALGLNGCSRQQCPRERYVLRPISAIPGQGGEIGRVRFVATGHVVEVAELECDVEIARGGKGRTRVRRVGIIWCIPVIRLDGEGSSFPISIRR